MNNNNSFKILQNSSRHYNDERGYLEVLYEQSHVVLKRSFSKAGVFRGMHIQLQPYEQTKIIRVVSGRILDFVMDPLKIPAPLYRRKLSPSDGWVQIDPNLAHGFYAIEDTEFEYLCLGAYNEAFESSYSIIDVLKSELGLLNLKLSEKDRSAKPIDVINMPELISL